jgi:hypothetical protein
MSSAFSYPIKYKENFISGKSHFCNSVIPKTFV